MNTTEARAELRKLLPPGTTVRTILRHVSSSGMSRCISLVVEKRDGIHDITWLAMHAVPGWRISDRFGGIKVSGAGMDMGFHLVYTLSATLYPDGFNCTEYKRGPVAEPDPDAIFKWHDKPYRAVGDRKYPVDDRRHHCPANDHVNYRNRSQVPYHHASGGYALQHNWL